MALSKQEESLLELGNRIHRLRAELARAEEEYRRKMQALVSRGQEPVVVTGKTRRRVARISLAPDSLHSKVLEILDAEPSREFRVAEIAGAMGRTQEEDTRFNTLRSAIGRLRQAGMIRQVGTGRYMSAKGEAEEQEEN